uniref:RNase H type-1 domain-containing protein n=1 Tax=Quercus lobata TaxID=97700 RepID=A0A7N2LFN5_QUELO
MFDLDLLKFGDVWPRFGKVAAHKNRRSKRSGYAYEAKTLEGNELFSGGASCGRKTQQLAIQDAVGEAILKAMQTGYNKILVLSNNTRLVQLCNQGKDPTWTEQNFVADMNQLQ